MTQDSKTTGFYRPTDAECRCLVCGDLLARPQLWLDAAPPDRRCPEGAKVVTECRGAMERARMSAWAAKEIAYVG